MGARAGCKGKDDEDVIKMNEAGLAASAAVQREAHSVWLIFTAVLDGIDRLVSRGTLSDPHCPAASNGQRPVRLSLLPQ